MRLVCDNYVIHDPFLSYNNAVMPKLEFSASVSKITSTISDTTF